MYTWNVPLGTPLLRFLNTSLRIIQSVEGNSAQQWQWHTQDFRMGWVEVPLAPRGWGTGMGYPYCPSPENFSYFLKIPYFDAFWHVYFLNYTPVGGVLTSNPPSPLLGTPLQHGLIELTSSQLEELHHITREWLSVRSGQYKLTKYMQ